MINALDTIWSTFITRLATINSQRKAVAYMDAMDWPPQKVIMDAFYLLSTTDAPLDKQSFSWAVPFYVHQLQFVWLNQGQDVNTTSDTLGRNRGNRVRIHWTMKEELVKALYPGFTEKITLTTDAGNSVNVKVLNEPLCWSMPKFILRVDKESGLLYGSATIQVTDMTEMILS